MHMTKVPECDGRWMAYVGDEMTNPSEVCRALLPFLSDGEVVEIHDAVLLVRWLDVDVDALEGRLERLMALRSILSSVK
jgi:hypothetical protein